MKRTRSTILLAAFASGLLALVWAQAPGDPLDQGFQNPPDSAKPRTWWHWTGGNITKDGITKDLEWMKRVGIGGMHLADVSSGSGQTVDKTLLFGSPEWLDAVRHAASEADRLGRNRRAVGQARTGHEEIRLERNHGGRAAEFCWEARAAALK